MYKKIDAVLKCVKTKLQKLVRQESQQHFFNIIDTIKINKQLNSSLLDLMWTHESLIYKRLISKICNNVRHYVMIAIQWSSDVKVLYW